MAATNPWNGYSVEPASVVNPHTGARILLLVARSVEGRRIALLKGNVMLKNSFQAMTVVLMLGGAAACAQTARGVVEDTKENASAVRGAVETVDVKTAIIADKTIDSGAIDVDTYQDKKLVVLRGSVPTEAQKQKAGQIAQQNATSYKIDNQLAVVPK
jgi:osmotically-inducible protein OsmY